MHIVERGDVVEEDSLDKIMGDVWIVVNKVATAPAATMICRVSLTSVCALPDAALRICRAVSGFVRGIP